MLFKRGIDLHRQINKKMKKMVEQPDLFFFDLFKKRLLQQGSLAHLTSDATKFVSADHEHKQTIPSLLDGIAPTGYADQIYQRIIEQYAIISHVRLGDISDRSFAIWDMHLPFLIQNLMYLNKMGFLIHIRSNGKQFFSYQPQQGYNLDNLTQKLNHSSSFIFEAKHPDLPAIILEIYLAKLSEGMFILKSNHVYLKKVPQQIEHHPKNNPIFDSIDIVYTWVDYQDSQWQALWHQTFPEQMLDADRFASNDELKFSLRSIAMYAPWVKHIYILTNCMPPAWFKPHEKIIFIDHKDVFPNSQDLPTFNSHAIEACLHHIPNLSENFIYMNDDVFLNRPVTPLDFFDLSGRSFSFFEPYGMVQENIDLVNAESYMIAAHNGATRLQQVFKFWPRQLHKHTPHALKKSVISSIEQQHSDIYQCTRQHKLRDPLDFSLISFFYHHFSCLNGTSIKTECSDILIRDKNYKSAFSKNVQFVDFFCINDGGGSANNNTFKKSSQNFLQNKFMTKVEWEK